MMTYYGDILRFQNRGQAAFLGPYKLWPATFRLGISRFWAKVGSGHKTIFGRFLAIFGNFNLNHTVSRPSRSGPGLGKSLQITVSI